MSTDPNEPVVLTSVPSEIEATLIADALQEQGFQVVMEGELTSGYRAEAPGEIRLMVRREQFEQARKALEELSNSN